MYIRRTCYGPPELCLYKGASSFSGELAGASLASWMRYLARLVNSRTHQLANSQDWCVGEFAELANWLVNQLTS